MFGLSKAWYGNYNNQVTELGGGNGVNISLEYITRVNKSYTTSTTVNDSATLFSNGIPNNVIGLLFIYSFSYQNTNTNYQSEVVVRLSGNDHASHIVRYSNYSMNSAVTNSGYVVRVRNFYNGEQHQYGNYATSWEWKNLYYGIYGTRSFTGMTVSIDCTVYSMLLNM